MAWPPGEPMAAQHVAPTLLSPPREAPLLRLAWHAAPRWKRRTVATVLLLASAAVTVVAPWMGALLLIGLGGSVYSIRGRRTFMMGTAVVGATVFVGLWIAIALVAAAVLMSSGPGRHGTNVVALVSSVTLVVVLCAQYAITLGRRRPRHTCPSPPVRYFASQRPECGIHAYRTLDQAVRRLPILAVETYGGEPTIAARVQLWGRCYEYDGGWRAQYGQIIALYDDDRGHVEIPAAVYGCAVEPMSAELCALRVTTEPQRWVRSVLVTQYRMRNWAARRRDAFARAQARQKGPRP